MILLEYAFDKSAAIIISVHRLSSRPQSRSAAATYYLGLMHGLARAPFDRRVLPLLNQLQHGLVRFFHASGQAQLLSNCLWGGGGNLPRFRMVLRVCMMLSIFEGGKWLLLEYLL